jgi:subtilase family serine protease
VAWHLDGEEVAGSHVSLDPGQVSNDNIRFNWTPTPGEHLLIFIADVDEHVQEPDEANNCAHEWFEL